MFVCVFCSKNLNALRSHFLIKSKIQMTSTWFFLKLRFVQDLLPQSLEAALLFPSTLKTSKKERLLPSNKRQMRQKWMFVYFPWGRKHLPQGCWSDLEGSEEVKKHSTLFNHISCSHTQLCVTEFKTWKVPKWSVTTFLRQLSYSELLYLSENTWLFYALCTLRRWDKQI